ncbi:hypothetical protein BJ875DRAFT_547388 [Amylocarpus encephaloides]|uniref:Glycine-rich domain-containing protein 1 n=1 Tax=Amylocarpus encephaloides TaxID=45428 RepID=A0A9P8BZZ5_9HELO|nr:hypothetical protein BJ875DRAFT_547388 [Amylocarpus encephaloides]
MAPAILGKLSSKLRSDDNQTREAPGDLTTSTIPPREALPSYTAEDTSTGPTQQYLSEAFSNLHFPTVPDVRPTPETCLAHLKLLHCIFALKEDIGYTDGLFGIWDGKAEMSDNRDETLVKMREKRWALYVARAVERFQVWWLKVVCLTNGAERLKCKDMIATNLKLSTFRQRGQVLQWTLDSLPPVDILMIWHSFMLNPRDYFEDCIKFDLPSVWATGMPWAPVNAAIDTNFNYVVTEKAKVAFVGGTELSWNNTEDPLEKKLDCPRCSQALEIPWTTVGLGEKQSKQEIMALTGTGYGDRDLYFICHRCTGVINHELLRVAHFKKDVEHLILRDWPLGGTILTAKEGLPIMPMPFEVDRFNVTFPNRLILSQLKSEVLDLISLTNPSPTMDNVKDLIEKTLKIRKIVNIVNNKQSIRIDFLRREDKIAIRKMMSRYWSNTSVFALELGGAVLRQGVFVDKMHSLDWLHSPAASHTMRRLVTKYERFIRIMSEHPLRTAVPTLDVDLAWHTHQLSPRSYSDFTIAQCAKFIDHDDKISEDLLETGFEFTSKTYEQLYHEVYSECTCWYCEAIRSKHISSSSRIFGTSTSEKLANNFHASDAAKFCPPDNSAHISVHNAVKIEDDTVKSAVYERLRTKRQKDLDIAYEKAKTRAQAKGREIPPKDQYYYGAWGYPYMMYGPYMAVPMYGGVYYAGDPGVMPIGAGMAGSCAAGTCSGGIGAGGCGGPGGCGGGGGCGASGMGGCGSGGGGGGSGGCGGGGCGGGGGGGS